LTARSDGLALYGVGFSRAELEARFDGSALQARLAADQKAGGRLRAEAEVPLAATAPWKLSLDARTFVLKLRPGGLGGLRQLDGTLGAALAIAGTRAQPSVSGRLTVDRGALAIADDPRVLQNATLAVTVKDGRAQIEKLAAELGRGKLRAHATVALDGLSPTAIEAAATAEQLPITDGPVGAWVDADVTLRGHRANAHSFTGDLVLKKGTARLPKIASGKRLQDTGPLKDVEFVDDAALRARARRRAAENAELPTRALVTVHIPGPFHVRSPEMRTDLAGELQIELIGPLARITGDVETQGGWIELLGRRYDLERVRLGFNGANELNPDLDVRITRELPAARIAIEVRGTAKKPQLTFSSEPPIYDESQIVGIVVSGDPGATRVSDRSLDQKVVGALSSTIVRRIKDQIVPGLPIDVLKVDVGATGYTGIESTRVEVGKYLTENIYVSYVHQFGAVQIGTHKPNANEAAIEWRFKRNYGIATRFGDAGAGAIDFYWTLRY
jgi:translocation and assembly module TamB